LANQYYIVFECSVILEYMNLIEEVDHVF
jgi:hypothetical protein